MLLTMGELAQVTKDRLPSLRYNTKTGFFEINDVTKDAVGRSLTGEQLLTTFATLEEMRRAGGFAMEQTIGVIEAMADRQADQEALDKLDETREEQEE